MKTVLVPLAQGCEELEATTIIDLLRRADIQVVAAGLDDQPVRASRGMTIVPDMSLRRALEAEEFDMVVLPGGQPGSDNLNNDSRIHDLLRKTIKQGKVVAAICAAPIVLAKAGLLDGKKATSYPGCIDQMGVPGLKYTGGLVERDGQVVTARGPGAAMDFALALIEILEGADRRNKVEKALLRP